MNIYLDNAATTPLEKEVIELMYQNSINLFGNPSSTHSFGRKAKAAIEKARNSIAKYLNASPLDIVFTSCGTESNNMVLKMATETFDLKHIIVSEAEHKCVLNTAQEIADKTAVQVHVLKVNQFGVIDLKALAALLESLEGKTLVSIMHANNETGSIVDIAKIGEICKQHEALFHSDTVQTIAHYPFDVQTLAIDFLSGSAHKFHGPKGVGFLYMKQKTKLKALINGGGQERNYRSGTENLLSILAMEKALEISVSNMEAWKNHILELKNYFITRLENEIADIAFNGDLNNSLYTVLSVSFPSHYNKEMFLFHLDLKGIAVSGGSACTSGANTGSHVMTAINHPLDRKAVRFSFSHYNTKAEIDYVMEVLKAF